MDEQVIPLTERWQRIIAEATVNRLLDDEGRYRSGAYAGQKPAARALYEDAHHTDGEGIPTDWFSDRRSGDPMTAGFYLPPDIAALLECQPYCIVAEHRDGIIRLDEYAHGREYKARVNASAQNADAAR